MVRGVGPAGSVQPHSTWGGSLACNMKHPKTTGSHKALKWLVTTQQVSASRTPYCSSPKLRLLRLKLDFKNLFNIPLRKFRLKKFLND